ncbi:glycosyltransferase family 4 protein [Thermococcus sp.]
MKILLVSSGYPPDKLGGAGLYVKYLAEELAKKHEVHLFISSRRESELEEDGISIHAVKPVSSISRAVLIDRTYRNSSVERAFKDVLSKVRPDVVHLNNIWAFRTGLLPKIAKGSKAVTVQTLHDYWFVCPISIMSYKKLEPCSGPFPGKCAECWNHVIADYLKKRKVPKFASFPFLKLLNRTNKFSKRLDLLRGILNSVDAVISPSRFLAEVMRKSGIEAEKLHVIPNGYPHRIFENFRKKKDTDKIVFGFVGVPSYQKGTHVAVKAAKLLESDFELRLYGGGGDKSYVSWIKSLAENDPRIKFMGRFEYNQVTLPYSQIDVLIFPSLIYENCPLVLAEASLSGTPVIASNLGAIPEFVHHGENGFLFSPGDSRELARLMGQFLEDSSLIKKLSSKKFPPDDMPEHARKILRLYNSL